MYSFSWWLKLFVLRCCLFDKISYFYSLNLHNISVSMRPLMYLFLHNLQPFSFPLYELSLLLVSIWSLFVRFRYSLLVKPFLFFFPFVQSICVGFVSFGVILLPSLPYAVVVYGTAPPLNLKRNSVLHIGGVWHCFFSIWSTVKPSCLLNYSFFYIFRTPVSMFASSLALWQ